MSTRLLCLGWERRVYGLLYWIANKIPCLRTAPWVKKRIQKSHRPTKSILSISVGMACSGITKKLWRDELNTEDLFQLWWRQFKLNLILVHEWGALRQHFCCACYYYSKLDGNHVQYRKSETLKQERRHPRTTASHAGSAKVHLLQYDRLQPLLNVILYLLLDGRHSSPSFHNQGSTAGASPYDWEQTMGPGHWNSDRGWSPDSRYASDTASENNRLTMTEAVGDIGKEEEEYWLVEEAQERNRKRPKLDWFTAILSRLCILSLTSFVSISFLISRFPFFLSTHFVNLQLIFIPESHGLRPQLNVSQTSYLASLLRNKMIKVRLISISITNHTLVK